MERQGPTTAVLGMDYFPPELRRLCRTAMMLLAERPATRRVMTRTSRHEFRLRCEIQFAALPPQPALPARARPREARSSGANCYQVHQPRHSAEHKKSSDRSLGGSRSGMQNWPTQ